MKVQNFFSGRRLEADDLKGEQAAGKGRQPPATSAAASTASDSFERSSRSPLAAMLSGHGGGAKLPDLPGAETRPENLRAKEALYAAARLEETKLASVADRLVALFGDGMLPIGRESPPGEGLPAPARQQLAEAVGRATSQVRADPPTFVEADGSVKPQLGALVRNELSTAEAAAQGSTPTSSAVLGSLAEGDIEALAFLVVMQAATSAKEDLKAIMDGVKAINAAKAQHRELAGDLKAAEGSSAPPSGTGKTMASEVLAPALAVDSLRVDLAATASKYIGETEKNLSRVFAPAEASDPILAFDEGDALFGKRTEVKDSHDRFADLEVSPSRPARDDD